MRAWPMKMQPHPASRTVRSAGGIAATPGGHPGSHRAHAGSWRPRADCRPPACSVLPR
jgi:hypothetical protein